MWSPLQTGQEKTSVSTAKLSLSLSSTEMSNRSCRTKEWWGECQTPSILACLQDLIIGVAVRAFLRQRERWKPGAKRWVCKGSSTNKLSAKTPLTGIAQGLNFLTGEATLVWRHFLNYVIPILFFGYAKDGSLLFMFMFYSFYQMYYYSDVQTTHTTYPDGLEVLQFPRFEYSKMCYSPEVS